MVLAGLLLRDATMPSARRAATSNRCEILIGRTLASCVHPLAAWRTRSRSFRVMLLTGYFAAGYIAVLAVMIFAG